jgi:ABC transport system ATP-binding/permease protein
MSLQVNYQGKEFIVEEGSTALIGSGERSTIQIARPGISRQHAAIAYDGSMWKVEDAGSRNGTFENGERVQVTTIDGPKTLVLGHPTDGEVVQFREITSASGADVQSDMDAFVLPDAPPAAAAIPATAAATRQQRTSPPPRTPTSAPVASDPSDLTAAIRDQIAAIKGLTWSVWAMIAVTAALCVLTLFVGILGS